MIYINDVISTNGTELSICRIGNGFPTILIHGNRDTKENFIELAKSLFEKNGGEYILIDLRGHGKSQKAASGYDIDNFVEDILGVVKVLQIKKFNYVGHSLGSTIGIKFASKYPEYINKLVLMSAASTFKIGFQRPEFTKDNFREQLIETNKRACGFFFSKQFPEVEKKITDNWLKVDFDVHMQMIQLEHPDLREDAKKVLAPALILTGENDKSTTINDAELLANLIPNSFLEIMQGSHYMFLEYPGVAINIIGRFLK